MSWSVGIIGTPHALKQALVEKGEHMLGDNNKQEFMSALPSLLTLIGLNEPSGALSEDIFELIASGHGTFTLVGGLYDWSYRRCAVSLRSLTGTFVTAK